MVQHEQTWVAPVHPCSGPGRLWLSPSGALCARCECWRKCNEFSSNSPTPGRSTLRSATTTQARRSRFMPGNLD